MYAFIIYDKANHELFVLRDHIGIVPLYIGYGDDGSIWVASEMKAIAPDCKKLAQFPPGHTFWSKTGEAMRWYNPLWKEPCVICDPELPCMSDSSAKLREALSRSVESHMMADVPWGVLLSGGLDSSLVASIAARAMRHISAAHDASVAGHPGWFPQLHSFCIGLKGSPDQVAAAQVAAFLGTVHHSYTYTLQEGIDALSQVILIAPLPPLQCSS